MEVTMSNESTDGAGRQVIVFPVEVTVRPWTIDRGVPMFPTQHQYVEITGRDAIFVPCECVPSGAR